VKRQDDDPRDRILADAVIPMPANYPAAALALSVAADAIGVNQSLRMYAEHKNARLRDEIASSAEIQIERLLDDWQAFKARHAVESSVDIDHAVGVDGARKDRAPRALWSRIRNHKD
jgi:hypothetical protein